jgi:hypothetical protein
MLFSVAGWAVPKFWRTAWHWSWRHCDPLKCPKLLTQWCSILTQKIWTFNQVKLFDLKPCSLVFNKDCSVTALYLWYMCVHAHVHMCTHARTHTHTEFCWVVTIKILFEDKFRLVFLTIHIQVCPPYPLIQFLRFTVDWKKSIWKLRK